MEPRYLLDTNICIYIRQKRPEEVLRRFRKLRSGEAALSAITYGELLYGAAKSEQRVAAHERLRELAHLLPALSLPESAAEAFSRSLIERHGAPRPSWQRTKSHPPGGLPEFLVRRITPRNSRKSLRGL